MNLSDEDKKQIEEEEAYRKQVREQENYRTQLHGNKKKGISWGTIILILLVIFVAFPVLGAIILIKINPAKYSNDSEQKVVASPSPIINSVSIVAPKTKVSDTEWENMINNCAAGGHKAKACICLYSEILNNYTIEEMEDLKKEYYNTGVIPQAFQDVAKKCGTTWIEP